jgi:hypothetical protein
VRQEERDQAASIRICLPVAAAAVVVVVEALEHGLLHLALVAVAHV